MNKIIKKNKEKQKQDNKQNNNKEEIIELDETKEDFNKGIAFSSAGVQNIKLDIFNKIVSDKYFIEITKGKEENGINQLRIEIDKIKIGVKLDKSAKKKIIKKVIKRIKKKMEQSDF